MTSEDNRAGPPIRRVVTGQAENGKTVTASDTYVPPIVAPLVPGATFFNIWGADVLPSLPDDGAEPHYRTWFPPIGGYRFEAITIPPDGTQNETGVNEAQALAKTEKLLPGLMDVMDPDHPGWHTTDTIDLIYIVSGECVLKLDSGERVPLKAGDTLIQNGALHAWGNPGRLPCALLVVSFGVKRKA